MKQKIAILTILISTFSVANAGSQNKSVLIGVAGYNDQNTAHQVCAANNIVDPRCESGKYKAVTIGTKYNAKGTFGSIVLIKNDNPALEKMNFKNLAEGKEFQFPFVKVKLANKSGKPAELVEIIKSACFWSVDPSTSNGSGGAVCQKLGFDYHLNSDRAALLKNPNGGYDEKATH